MASVLAMLLAGVAAAAGLALTVTQAPQLWRGLCVPRLERQAGDLSRMFVFLEATTLAGLTAASSLVAGAVGLGAAGPAGALVGLVAGLGAPAVALRGWRARRLRACDASLPDALASLAGALRSGLSLPQALEQAACVTRAPLGQELGLAVRELRLGATVPAALAAFAARVPTEDVALAAAALELGRVVGGDLPALLDGVAASVRERLRVEGRLRTLTAQGRLQGTLLSAMPVVLAVILDALRPELTRPLLHHPLGWAAIALVVVLELAGALLARRVLRLEP